MTGAGRGSGRGVAIALAREGAAVAIVEIDPQTAAATAAEIEKLGARAVAIGCDACTRDACEAAVAKTIAVSVAWTSWSTTPPRAGPTCHCSTTRTKK